MIKKYIIELETLEPLAASSGEGRSLLDNDIHFDQHGLPYIPAKRVRGALRESAMELIEMGHPLPAGETLNVLFGVAGSQWNETKSLILDNFHLKDNNEYVAAIEEFNGTNKENANGTHYAVMRYFTQTINQTAINFETGIADDYSLRSYRVLKRGQVFRSVIEFDDIYKEFISRTIINLSWLGSRRNRGWGKVKLRLFDEIELSAKAEDFNSSVGSFNCLRINFKTKTPVLLGGIQTEQSAISTDLYFRGNVVRGIFVSQLLDDPDFKNLFNNGMLQFTPAYKDGLGTTPLCLHIRKGEEHLKEVLNVFTTQEATPTRTLRGQSLIEGNLLKTGSVETISNFHHNRNNNRIAARSIDGKIFYYEALGENQDFTGYVYGDQEVLEKILKKRISDLRVGRSQRTQYGKITVSMSPVMKSSVSLLPGNEIYMVCQGQVVVFNETGNAIADTRLLRPYFGEGNELEIMQSAISIEKREGFSAVWKSRSQRLNCFAPGSAFLLKNNSGKEIELKSFIGEKINEGYGHVVYYNPGELENLKSVKIDKKKTDLKRELNGNPELKEWLTRENDLVKIRLSAMARARKGPNLPNSLISRVIDALEYGKTDHGKFLEKLKEFQKIEIGKQPEDRYASKKLKEVDLWDELVKADKYNYYEWITFFRFLRKKKK